MNITLHTAFGKLFKDKQGNVVIAQMPNVAIIGWLAFKALGYVSRGNIQAGSQQLSSAFLFVWAYLEITTGVNYFRRLIGGVIMALLAVQYFM